MISSANFNIPVALWVWLFLAIYIVHITEEFVGGITLARGQRQMYGVNMTPRQFLFVNSIAVVLIASGMYLALIFRFPQWLLVSMATVVLINGFSHTITSARLSKYNPGVITGILIFIPLGVVTLLRLNESMSLRRFFVAVFVGIGAHAIISLLGSKGGKMFEAIEKQGGRMKAEG
ncbi:MAG: hypothetical protein AUG51_00925 [Acidobacteria bacterium 13_1_20CM_3_53_8]|nr:MAG: hypothetical protein AUG51_00925 [Acidobacteria bacterium 13_1_20CM_3_53_8]